MNPEIPDAVPDHEASLLDDLENYADANPRDLGNDQMSQLRTVFEDQTYGLYLFCRTIFGYKDLTQTLHLPLCQFVSRWGESELSDGRIITTPPNDDAGENVVKSYRRLMVRIPREHFKTSVCTRGNALWVLARDPLHDATIGIFNEKEDNPKSWIQAIIDVVESSRLFQLLWPEMLPRGTSYKDKEAGVSRDRSWKWGANGAMFARNSIGVPELSLEAHGIGGTAVGKHFTHMILDDIIGGKAADSPAVMESANSWVDNSRPLERPAENGNVLIPHTTWAYNDTYAHMLKRWPGEFLVYHRSILEDPETGMPDAVDGKAIMPEKISTRKAKQLLKTDSFTNWAQYMNIPKAGKFTDFPESWLRYGKIASSGREPVFVINDSSYDRTIVDLECGEETAPQFIPLSWMHKAVILDPAPSKPNEVKAEPSAGSGLVVVGKDPWGRRYALHSELLRVSEIDIARRVLCLCEEWHLNLFACEEVNFSAVYRGIIDYVASQEFNFRPDYKACFTEGRQKDVRIKQLMRTPMQAGYWYFNSKGTKRLVQELLEYPHGETVDLVDATAYTDEVVYRPETPGEGRMSRYERSRVERDRGATGYGEFM